MTPRACPREAEVAAAIRDRAWRVEDEDVRRHAEECLACAEVVAVCEALRNTLAPADRMLPSAGQVWHRATLARARRRRAIGGASAGVGLRRGRGRGRGHCARGGRAVVACADERGANVGVDIP